MKRHRAGDVRRAPARVPRARDGGLTPAGVKLVDGAEVGRD